MYLKHFYLFKCLNYLNDISMKFVKTKYLYHILKQLNHLESIPKRNKTPGAD